MADFGVGEVAATEGAKGAGEALAAPAAASEVVATPFAAAPAVTGTALAPAAAGAGGGLPARATCVPRPCPHSRMPSAMSSRPLSTLYSRVNPPRRACTAAG